MTVSIRLGSDMLSWSRISWRYWRGRNWWGNNILSPIDFTSLFHTISTLSTLGGGWRDITHHRLTLHSYEDCSISLLLESKDCVRDYSRAIIKEIPSTKGDFFFGEIYSPPACCSINIIIISLFLKKQKYFVKFF